MPSPQNKQAIKPGNFIDYQKIVSKEHIKNKKEDEQDELLLANLADLGGWQVLKEYIADLLEQVENLNKTALVNGASFETIGQNYVTSQLATDFLSRVINHVEDAREARDNRDP